MKYKSTIILFILILFSAISKSKPLDSLRTETINGKKFIIHKIVKGEGLYAIARKYSIDVQKIYDANPGKSNKINIGDLIRVPIISNDSFVIEENQKEKKLPEIKTIPSIKNKIIKTDSAFKKSETANVDEAHANADSRDSKKTKIHIVSQGETISKIAQRYKITPQLICKWNGLKNNKLEVGESLIVDESMVIKPYEKWNAPNSASAKTPVIQNILSNADMIEETGFASIGIDKNILHKNAPTGTLILITNIENGKQCYTKVTGNILQSEKDKILIIDKSIAQKLNAGSENIRIKIQYSLPLN